MRPAIREVELVDELLTKGQRVQLGGGTINESLIEVIEFGLPNPPAVGDHEPIQLRAISTSERAINRISKRTDAVRTALANIRPGRGQNSSPRPLTSSNRIDDHVRATTSNAASGYGAINCHTSTVGTTGSGSLVTGLLCTQAVLIGADLRSRSIKWLTTA